MDKQRKIALVTGGSRGLGRDSAISLAKKGIDVVITYNSQKEKADETVAEIEKIGGRAAALQLDAGNISSFENFKLKFLEVLEKKWGKKHFDFLINNAGFGIYSPVAELTEEQFDSLMNVHFKGVFFLTQKLLSVLADGGGIVNISSGLTSFTVPGSGAYAAMKGAVEILTKYMAKELGVRRIRVNIVAPGAINTEFSGDRYVKHPEIKDQIGAQTALGRIGEATDIGGVVASLCTDDMGWVNAQRIEASGGMML